MKTRARIMAAAAAGVLTLGTAAWAQTDTKMDSGMSAADKTFVMKAAQGGMAEVELGKLAQDKASSQDVKDFGSKMVQDHTKAGDDLKQVASKNNITVPDGLSAQDQAVKDRLSKLSGADFDRAYMRDMVRDHKGDVAEFQRESTRGKNPDVKSFAASTLPTLKEHLRMAQETAGKVMGSSANTK